MVVTRRIAHPSVDERRAQGKEARNWTPRSSHAGWAPAADRADPVALLEEQNVTREPDLVPVRHGRMMVSPFTFYRGAAKIMAADLADTPTAGLNAQLCGDAHLSNFGVFASPERRLLFDANDFDETLPAPDLEATYGLSLDETEHVIREQFRTYRTTLQHDRRDLLERFEVVDVARKVVGVGSVGTRAFIVPLHGRDQHDPLL